MRLRARINDAARAVLLASSYGTNLDHLGALFATARQEGESYLVLAATPSGPFATSISDLVGMIGQGLDRGVMALQVIGLSEGLGSASSAEAYLGHHLEPMLGAIRARLDAHVAAGEMRAGETRFAAIGLLAPMVIARLHQSELGGAAHYPMALAAFDAEHGAAFVRAHAA